MRGRSGKNFRRFLLFLIMAGAISSLLSCSDKGTTPADTMPPAAIYDLAVHHVTDTSIILIWTSPGDDCRSGTAAEYEIRYAEFAIDNESWESATHTTDSPVIRAAGTRIILTITNLEVYTEYYFAIKTVDAAGNWSPISNIAQCRTSYHINLADFPLETGTQWVYNYADTSTGGLTDYYTYDTVEIKITGPDTSVFGEWGRIWEKRPYHENAEYLRLYGWGGKTLTAVTDQVADFIELSGGRNPYVWTRIVFPLSPELHWRHAYTSFADSGTYVVGTPETVEVPAGHFVQVLPIRYDSYSPRTMSGAEITFWIAPNVGLIKCQGYVYSWGPYSGSRFTWELLSYSITE